MLQQQPSQGQVFARHPSGPEPALQHLQQPHQSQVRTSGILLDPPGPYRPLPERLYAHAPETWLTQYSSHKPCHKEKSAQAMHASQSCVLYGLCHLDGMCRLQELPRLPESLIHPEGPVPGASVGSFSFKMPGMDGWNGSPAPWQPPPHQQQSQQPQPQQAPQPQPQPPQQQQQQGGILRDFARPEHFAQHLFPQPQQAPGGGIDPEHMQV